MQHSGCIILIIFRLPGSRHPNIVGCNVESWLTISFSLLFCLTSLQPTAAFHSNLAIQLSHACANTISHPLCPQVLQFSSASKSLTHLPDHAICLLCLAKSSPFRPWGLSFLMPSKKVLVAIVVAFSGHLLPADQQIHQVWLVGVE